MTSRRSLVVLAGAGESPPLLEALKADGSWDVHVFMQSPARSFGWIESATSVKTAPTQAQVAAVNPTAVIDVTHPFDLAASDACAQLCKELALPRLHLRRREWRPSARDNWTFVGNAADAVALLPGDARVLATTGRGSETAFAATSAQVFLRQLSGHDRVPKVENVTYLFGQAPFSEEEEIALFREYGITHLLFRNTGGLEACTKIWAARALGLPVFMVRQPPLPEGPVARNVDEALTWLEGLT